MEGEEEVKKRRKDGRKTNREGREEKRKKEGAKTDKEGKEGRKGGRRDGRRDGRREVCTDRSKHALRAHGASD